LVRNSAPAAAYRPRCIPHSMATAQLQYSQAHTPRPPTAAMPQVNRLITKLALSTAMCLTLTGCIIWPTTDVKYPEISGTLRTAAGAPLASVQVDRCEPESPISSSVVTSDSTGAFALAGSTRRRWITSFYGDRPLHACFRTIDKGQTRDWTRRYYGDLPLRLRLRCTIEQAKLECFDETTR
jgi:hypothetical protein